MGPLRASRALPKRSAAELNSCAALSAPASPNSAARKELWKLQESGPHAAGSAGSPSRLRMWTTRPGWRREGVGGVDEGGGGEGQRGRGEGGGRGAESMADEEANGRGRWLAKITTHARYPTL